LVGSRTHSRRRSKVNGRMIRPYCDCLKSPRSRSATDQRKAAVWEWFSVFTQRLLGRTSKSGSLYPAETARIELDVDEAITPCQVRTVRYAAYPVQTTPAPSKQKGRFRTSFLCLKFRGHDPCRPPDSKTPCRSRASCHFSSVRAMA